METTKLQAKLNPKWRVGLFIFLGIGLLSFVVSRGDRELWSKNYGATPIFASLTPNGQLVIVVSNRVEVLDGNGKATTLLTRPSTIDRFLNQNETGFLLGEFTSSITKFRKYDWSGKLLWESKANGRAENLNTTKDGHFICVVDDKTLALFAPTGVLKWERTDTAKFDRIGFVGEDMIGYVQYSFSDVNFLDLDGNSLGDREVKPLSRPVQFTDRGVIAWTGNLGVTLIGSEGQLSWSSSLPGATNSTGFNSIMTMLNRVYADRHGNTVCSQVDGRITMLDTEGTVVWSFADIDEMPLSDRSRNSPDGRRVFTFSRWPDITIGPGMPASVGVAHRHLWIADLNTDATLNWSLELKGRINWSIPRSKAELMAAWKSGFRHRFDVWPEPLVAPDGVVYVAGFDGRDKVVYAFQGD